jgi:hypothetical protein
VSDPASRTLTVPGRSGPDHRDGFLPVVARALADHPAESGCRLRAAGSWIRLESPRGRPWQGWKLHVSAAVPDAEQVLGRALPVLLAAAVDAKVVASLEHLAELNSNGAAPAQAGKFLTVYPRDDRQAVRLAAALDAATAGLRGPPVLSDRPLRPGSLVHYRYGGFRERLVQDDAGRVSSAISTPDGLLVPDDRTGADPPPWVTDPFRSSAVAPSHESLLGGLYLPGTRLHRAPRGDVFCATDLRTGRHYVVKSARRHALLDWDGRDARDRLHAEYRMLVRLSHHHGVVRAHRLFEQDGDLFLVLERVAGVSLSEHVRATARRGTRMPSERVRSWGLAVASILERLHREGVLHRDVKSDNVMTAAGELVLLDFELAWDTLGSAAPHGQGTPGWLSPQQEAGLRPTVADDVYGFGALLRFLGTGADPASSAWSARLMRRPPSDVGPGLDPALAEVVAGCLDPAPERRPRSMTDVRIALEGRGGGQRATARDRQPRHRATAQELQMAARQLGRRLCAAARPVPHGRGLAWTHEEFETGLCRDVDTGTAGVVLALAELLMRQDDPAVGSTLRRGASSLAAAPRLPGPPLPGLYVGEAGVGYALLRAGQALGDRHLIDAAEAAGRGVAARPHSGLDLFAGSAGRLRFHLALHAATGNQEHLAAAIGVGEVILAGWAGTRPRLLGYARGVAGVADALLDLMVVTGDQRYGGVVTETVDLLKASAVPGDAAGVTWPVSPGGPSYGPFWCHGAAGVGTFLLHADAAGFRGGGALAAAAARTVARARWVGPGRCHGLAGNLEFLVEASRLREQDEHLRSAYELADLLMTGGPGAALPGEGVDYMFGIAGVLVALLRLGEAVGGIPGPGRPGVVVGI